MTEIIYMDYAATTPLDPRVRDRMLTCMDHTAGFGNPSSALHSLGENAALEVARAAEEVASLINCAPDELIWTSGATEADNLAVIGAAQFRAMRGRHIVATAIEHKAVLESCAWLETQGFSVTYVQADEFGRVKPGAIEAAITAQTSLVSVMHANNETGVVQDIATIGAICRAHDVLLHVDAAQSAGKLPIDVRGMQIDLLSINAHKACGPKGIGALYLNAGRIRRVTPMLFGGGQQRGIRPGTLPVHQIVGMGETMRILRDEMQAEVPRIQALRDRLWQGIDATPGVLLNGDPLHRLCSIVNVSVAEVEGESLRFALAGLAISTGSACNTASGEGSYVLRSLGRSDQQVESSVRFSLGRFSTEAEVDRAIEIFAAAVKHLRALAWHGEAG
jgi:cysteine desulfurase